MIGLSFMLPSATTLIFTTFPCVELDTGERWLVADKSIDYDGAGQPQMPSESELRGRPAASSAA